MQMNLIEANFAQRAALPLPSAALVIDMRGSTQDDVKERLRIEIADLAGEMKAHNMHHWRFLTDFLSFRAIAPLRPEDAEAICPPPKSKKATPPPSGATTPSQAPLIAPFGAVQPNSPSSHFQSDSSGPAGESRPLDMFQQRIGEIAREIDRLRNNRIKAVNDLSRDGMAGHSVMDATVRILFLVQSEDPESLSSASIYAAHLKEHARKLERQGYQNLVSTTIVCLDNRGDEIALTDIIERLRWQGKWEHLDSLIITEKYADNAAFIAGAMQTYLAEMLLYVLLIIPPLRLKQANAPEIAPEHQITAQAGAKKVKGEWVTLPYHSYLIGLGSMEHSARWGLRWLNYSLVAHAAEVLQHRTANNDEEERSRNVVSVWLSDWRGRVGQAILDRTPWKIVALQAIPNAINVAKPAQEVFTINYFSPRVGEITINELESYLSDVTQTYNIPLSERARLLKDLQQQEQSANASLDPTLQDAIDSIPLIQQRLRDWEDKDPTLKKGTPLTNAQLEAQRVLTDPNFFTGATRAVPRARVQLQELYKSIGSFQHAHEQTTLNLTERQANLKKKGRTLIDDLQKHVELIPLLGKTPLIATIMAFLMLVLAFCVTFLAVLFGLAWLEHAILTNVPSSSPFFEAILASPIVYVFWIVVVGLTLATVVFFRDFITGKKRSAWANELVFWLGLIVFTLASPFLGLSLSHFSGDPYSTTLVSWLTFLPYWSSFTGFLALVMLAIEAFWFWRWFNFIMLRREEIVNDLRTQHKKDIDELSQYISDTVALEILLRAGLTDGNGGPGSYYQRVDHLNKRLSEISAQAKIQSDLAANRLALSLSETQPGAPQNGESWLNLGIREEWLDMESLTAGFQRLGDRLTREAEELNEFAQLLLRLMGEETPIQIEQQFRERPFSGNREQRQMQILMAILATLVLRFSIAAPTVDSMTPIVERYDAIDSLHSHKLTTLSLLIDTLRKKIRDINLQPLLNPSNPATVSQALSPEITRENALMATGAFASWIQMLWEGKDPRLEQTLDQKGILAKLIEHNQDPKAVLRRLAAHAMLFGRSDAKNREGFLLLSPSQESSDFRQSLNIASRLIVDLPDPERLVLLYIQRYIREATFVPEPEPTPPTLKVSPQELTFSADARVATQSVTVGNTGDEVLSWTATLDPGAPTFLSLAIPPNTNLDGETETTLTVHANTTAVTATSTFSASMTIHAFDPQTGKATQGSPVKVPITIDVVAPTMHLSKTSLEFTLTAGTLPATQTVDITNTDANALAWAIDKPPQTWLHVSVLAGNNAPSQTLSITFSVDGTDLTSGTYYANVKITPARGTPATITVKLIVV